MNTECETMKLYLRKYLCSTDEYETRIVLNTHTQASQNLKSEENK